MLARSRRGAASGSSRRRRARSASSASTSSVAAIPSGAVPMSSPTSLPDLLGAPGVRADELHVGMVDDRPAGEAGDVAGGPQHDAVGHGHSPRFGGRYPVAIPGPDSLSSACLVAPTGPERRRTGSGPGQGITSSSGSVPDIQSCLATGRSPASPRRCGRGCRGSGRPTRTGGSSRRPGRSPSAPAST